MKNTLLILAHPDLKKSRANRSLLQHLQGLPNLTISNLYEKYPYFHIRVEDEKKLLLENENIVFQFPLYWYSVPPILKLWFDQVLEFGFAYGPQGTKLSGKKFQVVLTTGGDEKAYSPSGMHENSISVFYTPLKQTARLCKMLWQEPLVIHGAGRIDDKTLDSKSEQIRHSIFQLGENT